MNLRHMGFALLVGSIALAGLSRSAMADTRDDVLSTVQRCDSIPDDRTWLDCYYGAAQLMRQRLGLAPAPEAQIKLVPPPVPGAPVYARPSAAPRLNADGLPPIEKHHDVGIMESVFGSGKPLVANQRMKSYTMDRGGFFTITLPDGQIWAQDQGDTPDARWKADASHYVVNIYEGALGTYNLEIGGESHVYKIHRVK